MRTICRYAASVATMFLLVGVAHAQIIRGKVIVHATQPPDHIEVVLELDGQPIIRSYADSSGAFFFRGIPYGAYELTARADGYIDASTRVELAAPPAGDSAPIVQLQLDRKPPDPVESRGDPLIDITQLRRSYSKKVLREFEKGLDESRKQNAAKSITHLETVVREARDFYDAHNLLGAQYQELGRFADAEKEYNEARTLNPAAALPLINLGNLYLKQSNLGSALQILSEAVKLNAQSAVAFYLLGLSEYKSGRNDDAEKSLTRALQLDSHMAATRLALLNLYAREEKWESALQNLDAYLAENPKAANRSELETARLKVIQNTRK